MPWPKKMPAAAPDQHTELRTVTVHTLLDEATMHAVLCGARTTTSSINSPLKATGGTDPLLFAMKLTCRSEARPTSTKFPLSTETRGLGAPAAPCTSIFLSLKA